MNKYITLLTFTYPTELAVIRGRLESEGIECIVLDENTVQVHPFYSNAIGGIKLQVRVSDFERARKILKEAGYELPEEPKPVAWVEKLEVATERIPLAKKLRFEHRVFVLTALVVLVISIVAYIFLQPSTYERLTSFNWCVHKVYYNNETYRPYTVNEFDLSFEGTCHERIVLWDNGQVQLPGFDSPSVRGRWMYDNKTIRISELSSWSELYSGAYEVKLSQQQLVLTSHQLTIVCYPQKKYFRM